MINNRRTSADLFGFAAKICCSPHDQQLYIKTTSSRAYLEDVKALVLHHLPIVLQLPHDELEVLPRLNVAGHDLVELPVEQYLAQQLDRLTLRNVALGPYERVVIFGEEKVKIRINVFGNQRLVPYQYLLRTCQ